MALRRDLHRHPELGLTEFRTASIVASGLRTLGYEVRLGAEVMAADAMVGVPSTEELAAAKARAIAEGANRDLVEAMDGGRTGVVGVLEGARPGPTVAFRFDLDALPIQEAGEASHAPAAAGFASAHPGIMHACGHDGHTASGLALAERLAGRDFSGRLKLIFQPAEEGGRGAAPMVAAGVVDDVDRLFCYHLGLGFPLGTFCGGVTGFLATTKLEAIFHGVEAHAGMAPEKGVNALLAACTATLNLHAMPPFGSGPTRINVGVLTGGTATNIVPGEARLRLETRAHSGETNLELERRARRVLAGAAEMYGARVDVSVRGAATDFECSPELAELACQEAQLSGLFDECRFIEETSGSEDAGFLIKRVQEKGGQATYMMVPCPLPSPHHSPRFDIEEESIGLAVELLERVARRCLR